MSGQANGQIPAFRHDRLNAEIARRFLTNDEAAQLVGVPTRTLHRWRKGTNPRKRHLRLIASAFEKDPAWFVEQDPPDPDLPRAA